MVRSHGSGEKKDEKQGVKGKRKVNKSQGSARTAEKGNLRGKAAPALQADCTATEREQMLMKPQEGSRGSEDHGEV